MLPRQFNVDTLPNGVSCLDSAPSTGIGRSRKEYGSQDFRTRGVTGAYPLRNGKG